ncbi:MAG: DNA/RNA nuclease SfsA [Pseudomonadota bacterium]
MRFATPLQRGTLLKRYKRFLADITLDTGETITASCPNTGSMKGLSDPGLGVWVSQSDSPTRKYRHTLELVEVDAQGDAADAASLGSDGRTPTFVGINTGRPNAIVEEAVLARRIATLKGYRDLKREQKYGVNSRIDLLLSDPRKGTCYVEVKNVHLVRQARLAEFPDSVTARGAKHLAELASMVAQGHRAVMVFLVQRADVTRLKLARDIDEAYGAAYDAACAAGVEGLALRCRVTPEGIEVERKIPVEA